MEKERKGREAGCRDAAAWKIFFRVLRAARDAFFFALTAS